MFAEFIIAALKNLIFWGLNVDNSTVFPKPLSKAEEQECFRKMHEENDATAKNKLIEHNLRLVAHIIKKYYSNSGDQQELFSIGTIGLIKSVSTFDYTKGTKLVTYASKCIENELLMHFRSTKKSAKNVYIDDPIDSDKDGNSISLLDIIADNENITEKVDLIIRSKQLYSFISQCLDKRELEIICLRYGIYGYSPHTQKAVAEKLNISRSYVSRIEKKALLKLREMYEKTPYC